MSEEKEVIRSWRAAWNDADNTPRDVRTLPVQWVKSERIALLIRRVMFLAAPTCGEFSSGFGMPEGCVGASTRPGVASAAPGLLQTVSRKQAERNAIAKEWCDAAEEERLSFRQGSDDDSPHGPHKDMSTKGPTSGKVEADADQ